MALPAQAWRLVTHETVPLSANSPKNVRGKGRSGQKKIHFQVPYKLDSENLQKKKKGGGTKIETRAVFDTERGGSRIKIPVPE